MDWHCEPTEHDIAECWSDCSWPTNREFCGRPAVTGIGLCALHHRQVTGIAWEGADT